MTSTVSFLPDSSITANLHPVRKAGSKPKILLFFIGACKSSLPRLSEKTSILASWAFSVRVFLTNLSKEG